MKTVEFVFQDDHIPNAHIHAHIDDLDMLRQYCDRYSVSFTLAIALLVRYPNATLIDFTQVDDEIDTCSCIDCETVCSEACEICMPELQGE